MKKKKIEKGITLIALIITIIMLLILAVVTIREIQGDGIIAYAKSAQKEYLLGKLSEEVRLVLQERKIKEETGEIASLKEDLEKGISGGKIVEEIDKSTCSVTRDNQTILVSEDGTITEGKVSTWDGITRNKPTIDEEGNWHIQTEEELKFLADFVNGELEETEKENLEITVTTNVYLENDLDLGARFKDGELTKGKAWTPIGKDENHPFTGNFYGKLHSIKGVFIKQEADYAGLFGYITSVSLEALELKDSYIEGRILCGRNSRLCRRKFIYRLHEKRSDYNWKSEVMWEA